MSKEINLSCAGLSNADGDTFTIIHKPHQSLQTHPNPRWTNCYKNREYSSAPTWLERRSMFLNCQIANENRNHHFTSLNSNKNSKFIITLDGKGQGENNIDIFIRFHESVEIYFRFDYTWWLSGIDRLLHVYIFFVSQYFDSKNCLSSY